MTYIHKGVQTIKCTAWQTLTKLIHTCYQDPSQEIEYNEQYKILLKTIPATMYFDNQHMYVYQYKLVLPTFQHLLMVSYNMFTMSYFQPFLNFI